MHDLMVLPDLDVQQWIRANPGECARVPVDRTGNILARTPVRVAAVAAFVEPCSEEARIEVVEVCEDDAERVAEPGVSEVPLAPPAPEPAQVPPVDELVWVDGFVSAGIIVDTHTASLLEPPPDGVAPLQVLPAVEEVVEPPRKKKRGLWRRLFGRKRNR